MGREGHCKQILPVCVGSAHSVWITLGLPQLKAVCASWVYSAQDPGCSAGELSKAGPAFRALPRSKLLGFRFSGTPQRHRLGWACILCPFPGSRNSGDRVLGWLTIPGVLCILSPPWSQPLDFLGVPQERRLRHAMSPLGGWGGGLISVCDPPGGGQPSRISGRPG